MITIQIVFCALSLICLLSLFGFMILCWLDRNNQMLYAMRSSKLLTFKQEAFLLFALLGFLICIYNGVEAMLFWLPDNWGSLDEDGEFQTVQSSLAGTLTIVSFGFIGFIEKVIRESFSIEALQIKNNDLKGIILHYRNEIKRTGKHQKYSVKPLWPLCPLW